MFFSRPPGLGTLEKALLEKRVAKPTYLEIQTGADDDVCCPELAGRVGRILGVDKLEIGSADDTKGRVRFSNATQATTTTNGSVSFDGGIGVVKNAVVGGDLINALYS